MSRTPLFRQLVDAMRAAAPSPTTKPPAGLDRRQFLSIGAVGMAGIAMAACERADRNAFLTGPTSATNTRSVNQTARIAIVGGGLAGLTCAYRLKQQGVMATVYEGNTRLGGRCWSHRGDFAGGQVAEHGGELIDQSHKQVRQLAQELGLTLDNLLSAEPAGTQPFYFFDGSPYTFDDATRDLKAIWQTLHSDLVAANFPTLFNSFTPRALQLDHMSLAQWIDQNVPGGRASRLGQLLETAYVIEYGADAEMQSALNLIYLIGFSGPGQLRIFGHSNEKYHVRGGNDLIVSGLANSLSASQIVMDSRLVRITRDAGGTYTLTFASGAGTRVVVADHVVLTVPFSVMRTSVEYANAGFNDVKLAAISQLGMGANAKLNMQFNSRAWNALGCNGDTYSDTGYQNTWEVTRAQPGQRGILVQYTGGSTTLAQAGKSSAGLTSDFLTRIEPVLPGLSAKYSGTSTFDFWPANPWTLGSYSYWKVGQYTTIAGAEQQRSANCHFAGEHTSIESQGYLNGAVESGERCSDEILGDLSAKAAA